MKKYFGPLLHKGDGPLPKKIKKINSWRFIIILKHYSKSNKQIALKIVKNNGNKKKVQQLQIAEFFSRGTWLFSRPFFSAL